MVLFQRDVRMWICACADSGRAAMERFRGARPKHPAGAQLGDLEEEIPAGRKRECQARCSLVGRKTAPCDVGQVLDGFSQRKSELLGDGGAGVMKPVRADGDRAEPGQRANGRADQLRCRGGIAGSGERIVVQRALEVRQAAQRVYQQAQTGGGVLSGLEMDRAAQALDQIQDVLRLAERQSAAAGDKLHFIGARQGFQGALSRLADIR